MTRISADQAWLLTWVLGECKRGAPAWRGGVYLPKAKTGITRSRSAAISRALRRLEQRGLVVRMNGTSDAPGAPSSTAVQMRTTHVRLTDAGRELAEQCELAHRLTEPDISELTG